MGLGSLIRNISNLRAALTALGKFKDAAKEHKLKVTLVAVGSAILTGVVASISGACPGLFSQTVPILTAASGGGIAYLMRRPTKWPGAKAWSTGFAVAIGGILVEQLNTVCGGGFVKALPSLVTAGVCTGFFLWVRAPHEPIPAPAPPMN